MWIHLTSPKKKEGNSLCRSLPYNTSEKTLLIIKLTKKNKYSPQEPGEYFTAPLVMDTIANVKNIYLYTIKQRKVFTSKEMT